ncbi:MAG TPA: hypothetical protein VHX15_07850 [Frankiaceae bacterium]|nr:hypothetical protein [Frankiaceae bacterium]
MRWLLSGAAVCNSLSSLLELTDWKGAPALAIVGAGEEWAAVGDPERLPESVRGTFDKVLNTAAGLVSVDAATVTGLWREGIESEKQRRNFMLGPTPYKPDWAKYGLKRKTLKSSLRGLREVTSVGYRGGFRRCHEELMQLVLGYDKAWSLAVWDQDIGGLPIETFGSASSEQDAGRTYLRERCFTPLYQRAVVDGPAAAALVHHELTGDYVLLACTGGGARGLWVCRPELVHDRLLVSPGCASWLFQPKAKKLGLIGEAVPMYATNFAFPWASWDDFLRLAGADVAQDPALDWHPLSVPSGTSLPDVVTLARDTMSLRG